VAVTVNMPTKMVGNDRILSLRPIEGKSSVATNGLIDKRLFTGDNKLHAIRGPNDSMWHLRYDSGIVPAALQQKFTSFNILFKLVTEYFNKRNIEVKEIFE